MGKLWEALDELRKGMMIKHRRDDGTPGHHCALGFLDKVYGRNFQDFWEDGHDKTTEGKKDDAVLAGIIKEHFPDRIEGCFFSGDNWTVANFNNHPLTTQTDLEMVFEKAAIKADEILS